MLNFASPKILDMNIRNLLPFTFAFLFLSACQKEADESLISTTAQSTPEYYLSKLVEGVLFQMDTEDLATGQHTGWLIDRNGEVRSYAFGSGQISMENQCDASEIGTLAATAETSLHSIPADEFVENIRLSRQVSRSNLGEATTDENETRITRLMVFRAMAPQNTASTSDDQCSNGPHANPASSERRFQRILLKSTGAHRQLNNSENAPTLINWMEGIEEKLNL